jgi:hypothetical protein
MKRQARDKGFKKKQQKERGRKNVKPAPQLPKGPNEAPQRVPPVRPPSPEDDL